MPSASSASHRTSTTTDENAPLTQRVTSVTSRKSLPSAAGKPRASTHRAGLVEIQLSLPSSEADEEGADRVVEITMPPTPPASQSPPRRRSTRKSVVLSSSQSLIPPSSSSSSSTRQKSRSRSSSARAQSQSASQPPPHAPQVLAARRRSSVSPLPLSQSQAQLSQAKSSQAKSAKASKLPRAVKVKLPTSSATSSSTTTKTTKNSRRRRSSLAALKRHPTPTETLEVPVGTRGAEGEGSDTEDPLLLKSADELRGEGEGRPFRARSRSRSLSRPVEEELEAQEEDEEAEGLQLPATQLEDEDADDDEITFRDEDLLPLGSGALDEDLPESETERALADESDAEEEEGQGGFDDHFQHTSNGATAFDLSGVDWAALQAPDSDSDVDRRSEADEAAEADDAQDDEDTGPATPPKFQPRHSFPRLPADQTGEYEYVEPIQPLSSSPPPRAPSSSSSTRPAYGVTRPSPFLATPELESTSEDEDESHNHPAATTSAQRAASLSPKVEPDLDRPLPALPRETWTRGPGFFRSSPTSSRSSSILGEDEDRVPVASDAHVTEQEEQAEEEAESDSDSDAEVEASLVLDRHPSLSPALSTIAQHRPACSPSPLRSVTRGSSGFDSDASMNSPSPRRLTTADVHMSSPSPRSPLSLSADQHPPLTPSPARGGDAVMASPTPARVQVLKGDLEVAPPPSSLERLRTSGSGIVQAGRATLQGLLFFGSGAGTLGPEREGVSEDASAEKSEVVPESQDKGKGKARAVEDDDDDEEGQEQDQDQDQEREGGEKIKTTSNAHASTSTSTSAPPTMQATACTSIFTPGVGSHSLNSSASGTTPNTARSLSARRRRPSASAARAPHIIEISSTDPLAAARAAAILKVYHDYVQPAHEEGREIGDVPETLLRQAGIRRSALRRGGRRPSEDESDEEEQHGDQDVTLLLRRAEEEVRRHAAATPRAVTGADTPLPSTSISKTARRIPTRDSSFSSSWTTAEWRRLETALVDEGRVARNTGRELVVEKVIARFVESEGLNAEACVDEWAWEKIATRVTALQKRRYLDSQQRRASRGGSNTPLELTRRLPRIPRTLEAELLAQTDRSESVAPASISIKAEELSDDESSLAPRGVDDNATDDDEEDDPEHNAEDDTFFERARPAIVAPVPAIVQPPLALASSRFAHLYDEPIEKPRLPSQSWAPSSSVEPQEEEEDEDEGDSEDPGSQESTPPPAGSDTSAQSPAKKLFSYLGGLVRRSTSTPEPTASEPVTTELPRPQSPAGFNFGVSLRSPFGSAGRPIRPLPGSTSTPMSDARPRPRTSSGGSSSGGRVAQEIARLEDAETSREEDEAELARSLGSGAVTSIKRRASVADLRETGGRLSSAASLSLSVPAKKPAVFVPSGTRALDKPIGEKLTRRW